VGWVRSCILPEIHLQGVHVRIRAMGFFSKWRTHKQAQDGQSVEVSEQDGVRFMHLGGSDTVQSAMQVERPNELELAYTRAMMAFLLFRPAPGHVLMIGLGGGSLAKFVHARLTQVRSTVVEISTQVITAARTHFFLPPDDERLSVVLGDGAEFVETHPNSCDVLLLDGYDGTCQVDSLSSQAFYEHCAAALSDRGILVVNLWGSDHRFAEYRGRIEAAFGGLVLCLPAEKRGNIIVFGFKKSPGMPKWDDLRERARSLEMTHSLEFLKFVERLDRMNLHTDKRLLV
jgi:spermidine synthase